MSERTEIGHVSQVPMQSGHPKAVVHPIHPEWFAGQHTLQLTKTVGISQFGANQLTLDPGAYSALRHWHEEEDEFVYVLSGELTLIDENGEHRLGPGAFAGFPAGRPNAHHLANRSAAPAVFLSIGTRKVGVETVHYPDDDFGPSKVERDAAGNRVGG